ncbi:chaps-domain-containing protein [Thelephora ganbajun]|uniref:Chaps-domain-containing protein n=1 Tax=Thelephora ganbajun TaxID=370292 RepID=A0ACB6ZT36_THEGA|nr:chaps-domain-containing protein [Thelephora ganbajun]
MADGSFKDVPEFFEVELGESIAARTESLSSFRELGPPDLCHVTGSYHYVSGVDASSSASLAAYINSLTYSFEDTSAWFSKGPTWKVRNGCYCCFNAFSRVDVRVDVKIPGGVHTYVIDLRGERHNATPEIWQETYLSAILRAILYSDDPTYWLECYRKVDPITTPESELRFLKAAEELFSRGWQVGSDPEIQVATVVSNHLTSAIMKYFGDSGRYQHAANLFEKLLPREPEVASLLAKSYIGMYEEVKAVQIMNTAMNESNQSYTLLHVQCEFLRSKGKHEWALKLARQAVNSAPSEFVTWEMLTQLYIDLEEYENALLTLNSCPMFTYNGRDAHRQLQPARVHLPPKGTIVEILPERQKTEEDQADPALMRLPAPGLRGTWARAYALLTRLVSKIGWDELLKTRSLVFVMEEEYRMLKAQNEPHSHGRQDSTSSHGVIHEDGSVHPSKQQPTSQTPTLVADANGGADDDASVRAVKESPSHKSRQASLAVTDIPTIRISTESDGDREREAAAREAAEEQERREAQEGGNEEDTEEDQVEDSTKVNGTTSVVHDTLEKPIQAAADNSSGSDDASSTPVATADSFSFSNKRLCERWLDNLFMVLYEDLRVWTIFRAEVAHYKTQHIAYKKTGMEWEILGDLGLRLNHKEEAKEAYQRCLDSMRFSHKPWLKLLEMYSEEGDLQRSLQAAIRVAAYQYADYGEMTNPTAIARCFFKLGQIHGHEKISYTLISMGLPDDIRKTMESYLHYGKVFKVEGHDF